MKRSDLLRHLRNHGCEVIREGGRHSWWGNPSQNRRSSNLKLTISVIVKTNSPYSLEEIQSFLKLCIS